MKVESQPHLHHVFMLLWIIYMVIYLSVNITFCVIIMLQLLFFQWIRKKNFKHKIPGKHISVNTWMLISLIPTNITSKLFAKIHRKKLPISARKSLYQLWATVTHANLDEMRYPLERYFVCPILPIQ
jgi:hypothetical protein